MNNKNILIVSDDLRMPSGVGGQSAEIIKGLAARGYNMFQIGVGQLPGEKDGTRIKINFSDKDGDSCKLITSHNYDILPNGQLNPNFANLILSTIQTEKINAVVLFQDPHRFLNVFNYAPQIRRICPLIFYTIWDTDLNSHPKGKPHYNLPFYESCDSLLCISAQTENFCRNVVSRLPETKRPQVAYVPHGIDTDLWKPLDKATVLAERNKFFGKDKYDFIVLFNSVNQSRKKPADLIYAFRLFCESLPEDKAQRTCLLLHTQAQSQYDGRNLREIIQSLAPEQNIFINEAKIPAADLNKVLNVADVVFLPSNAEGWGLSITEAMSAGKPVSATVTGGLQDQMGFVAEDGAPMKFDETFTSNNVGKYKKAGPWVYPMFPAVQKIIGSNVTTFLFDDEISHSTIKDALTYWYEMPKEEREERGLIGREFVQQNFNKETLTEKFAQGLEDALANHKKPKMFEIYTT